MSMATSVARSAAPPQARRQKELRESIRVAILGGDFRAGDRLPSENDLAAQYGVSRPTVREALGGLVQEGVLERFQGKGTFVSGARTAIRDIGFVLCGRGYTDPPFSMTLKGAEARCRERGQRLLFSHCDEPGQMDAARHRLLDHGPVRGLVVTGILDLRWMMRFMSLHENVVLVGDVAGRTRTPDIVRRIVSNNGEAAGEAMAYLLALGHRRIAHITGDLNRVWFREPCEAYVRSLQSASLPLDERLVVECADEGLDYGWEAANALLRLDERPTAIFASNDRFAWGAIRAIREAQLRVPEDVSVMGMNDLPLGDRRDFLTTMALDQERMGAMAVDHIIAGAAGATDVFVVPMRLTPRRSCAAVSELSETVARQRSATFQNGTGSSHAGLAAVACLAPS
jgi:DNA-binding LacI/PurR family transcriptional regulator